jgi:MFS family permease
MPESHIESCQATPSRQDDPVHTADPKQELPRLGRDISLPLHGFGNIISNNSDESVAKSVTMSGNPPSQETGVTPAKEQFKSTSVLDLEKNASNTGMTPGSGTSLSEKSNDEVISVLDFPSADPHEVLLSNTHKIALVLVACLAQFLNLGGMNQTVAPVMLLADKFHIHDYGTLSWFSAAYSMTAGTFILPAGTLLQLAQCRSIRSHANTLIGRLGDMYGHKNMFIIGWIWFALWSAISGIGCYSENILFFSICRAFQGIGPALLIPNAIALIGRNIPVGTQRNTAFACFGAAGPTGATAGAVATALIDQLAWAPWSFWALAIVCITVCLLAILVVPGNLGKASCPSPLTGRSKFDYWGCLTGVSGLVLVNFALNQAPLDGWTAWYIPFLLATGFISLLVFVMVELRVADHPLIPLRNLNYEAYFALSCIAVGWGSHGIWAYYLYLFVSH